MKLNKFTDYGLRLLMYLLHPHKDVVTIAQAALALNISLNHLVKVTHFMAKQGWIMTTRGKGGGISLAPQSLTLPLGEIVRILEHDEKLVNCAEPPCVLRESCGLNSVLDQALTHFYHYLNQYQLQDALRQPIAQQLLGDNIKKIKLVSLT